MCVGHFDFGSQLLWHCLPVCPRDTHLSQEGTSMRGPWGTILSCPIPTAQSVVSTRVILACGMVLSAPNSSKKRPHCASPLTAIFLPGVFHSKGCGET